MTGRSLLGSLLAVVSLAGCYRAARPFSAASFDRQPGWVAVTSVPVLRQEGARDCGAAVAAMLLQHWGVPDTQGDVRAASGTAPDRGLDAAYLRAYLRGRGLRAYLFEGKLADLEREIGRGRPVLVGILKVVSRQVLAHYQLVVGVNVARKELVVIDPADGLSVYSFGAFLREWKSARYLTLAVFPIPMAGMTPVSVVSPSPILP